MLETLIQKLADITPQRTLADVAKECAIVFADGLVPIKVKSFVVTDPFKAALKYTRETKKNSMAVFGRYFLIIHPDARWMQSLRLYQEMKSEKEMKNRTAKRYQKKRPHKRTNRKE